MQQTKKIEFSWYGSNQQKQSLRGVIKAKNVAFAKMQLLRQGIVVKQIRKRWWWYKVSLRKSINAQDICVFCRQLATMLNAGISLVKALDTIANSSNKNALYYLLKKLKKAIENGNPFHEALRQQQKHFDILLCNLVEAGEQSGTLDLMLERIATHKEKQQTLKKRLRKALTYPIAVIVIASIVTAILILKVMPQFANLFNTAGSNLPWFTELVINIARNLQQHGLFALSTLFLFAFIILFFRKHFLVLRKFTDHLWLRIPLFGTLATKAAIARFCHTLATILAAGMPLLDALQLSAKASHNLVYQTAIEQIRHHIATGEQFNCAMQMTHVFPPIIIQMAAIGEESGKLDTMMDKAADIFTEDIETLVDSLSDLLEPCVMSILGIIVGSLVIAMYLPIFKMGQII